MRIFSEIYGSKPSNSSFLFGHISNIQLYDVLAVSVPFLVNLGYHLDTCNHIFLVELVGILSIKPISEEIYSLALPKVRYSGIYQIIHRTLSA